jgi:hypothetical protein
MCSSGWHQAALLSQSELTDYISYARTHVQPILTDAAADQLVEGYVPSPFFNPSKRSGFSRASPPHRLREDGLAILCIMQTLQAPVLPWVSFRSGGFPKPATRVEGL